MIEPMRLLSAFKHKRQRTWYSVLHPMTKLMVFALFLATPLLFKSVIGQLVNLALVMPIVLLSRTGRESLNIIKSAWFFLIMIVGLNYLFTRNPQFSLAMGLRLIIMLVLSACFFATTDALEIGDILTQLRIPYYISFSFVMALRFVPVLARDAENITAAQQSRGLELRRGSILRRIRKLLPILIPLVIIAIRRSQQLAEALESRAFGSSGARTTYFDYQLSWRDVVFLAYALSVLLGLVWVRRSI